jgi:hypothetical protein
MEQLSGMTQGVNFFGGLSKRQKAIARFLRIVLPL